MTWKGKTITGAIIVGLVVGYFAAPDWVLDWFRNVRTRAGNIAYRIERSVAGKPGDRARAIELARQCRAMLRRIESAKRACAQRRLYNPGDTVPWDEVLKEMGLKEIPRCPAGGEYILGTIGDHVKCTIGANGTPDPADDHIVND